MTSSASVTIPLRVKFLSRVRLPDGNIGGDFLRRFPQRSGYLGGCEFVFDPESDRYDWLVVYDDLPRDSPCELLRCDPRNTLLITGEPATITHYPQSFLDQFGHVLTSQPERSLPHPGAIRRQPGLLWFYGGSDERGSYDALVAAGPPRKDRRLSSVCSTKAMNHTLHARRLKFTRAVIAAIPETDVFGYGMAPLVDKADALDRYHYHLAIENHRGKHHFTEKLADAFLGHCLPLYFGCTNLSEYFPEESYIEIDPLDPQRALARIREIVESDLAMRRMPAIIEARERVIHRYSTFAEVSRIVRETHHSAASTGSRETIFGRRRIRREKPLRAVFDGIRRILHHAEAIEPTS